MIAITVSDLRDSAIFKGWMSDGVPVEVIEVIEGRNRAGIHFDDACIIIPEFVVVSMVPATHEGVPTLKVFVESPEKYASDYLDDVRAHAKQPTSQKSNLAEADGEQTIKARDLVRVIVRLGPKSAIAASKELGIASNGVTQAIAREDNVLLSTIMRIAEVEDASMYIEMNGKRHRIVNPSD